MGMGKRPEFGRLAIKKILERNSNVLNNWIDSLLNPAPPKPASIDDYEPTKVVMDELNAMQLGIGNVLKPKPNSDKTTRLQGTLRFIKGAYNEDEYPDPRYPEVAFVGRSNVGKSSLINALTGTKQLEAADYFGVTKNIQFWVMGDNLAFVDMPGYGFSQVDQAIKDGWPNMICSYPLARKEIIQRYYILLDARSGMTDSDCRFLRVIEQFKVRYCIVLTKCDLVKRKALAATLEKTMDDLSMFNCASAKVFATSIFNENSLSILRRDILSCGADTEKLRKRKLQLKK